MYNLLFIFFICFNSHHLLENIILINQIKLPFSFLKKTIALKQIAIFAQGTVIKLETLTESQEQRFDVYRLTSQMDDLVSFYTLSDSI